MPQPPRPVRVEFRCTEAEYAQLRGGARLAGKVFARYVREAALGRRLVVPPSRFDRAVLGDLNRVGNNVNQLAREANAAREYPTEARLEAVMVELRGVLRAIVRAIHDGGRARDAGGSPESHDESHDAGGAA